MALLAQGALLLLTMVAAAGFRIPEKAKRMVNATEASGAADRKMNSQEASVAQKISFQTGAFGELPSGEYTIQQKQTGRYLDADTSSSYDYRAATGTQQNDNSQLWKIVNLGSGTYTLQQKYNNRYLDAYTTSQNGYFAGTRTAQRDDSQRWIIRPDHGYFTIQQKLNNRYLDAYTTCKHSCSGGKCVWKNCYTAGTRTAQGDDSQRWDLRMVNAIRATGEWESAFSCRNCADGINYSYRVETRNSAGSSIVVTEEKEVTGTIGAGFKFMSAEVSASVRTSVARETHQQMTKVDEQTFTIRCSSSPRAELFRWVVIAGDVYVKTNHFACHYTTLTQGSVQPKCPFGSCIDELCQECEPWRA